MFAFPSEMKSLSLAALILLASCSTLRTVTRETVFDRYQAMWTDEFRKDGTLKRTTIETHPERYDTNPTTVEVMITYDLQGYPLLQVLKINNPGLDRVDTYTTAFTVNPVGNIHEEVTLVDFIDSNYDGTLYSINIITYQDPGKPVHKRLSTLRHLRGGIEQVITGVVGETGEIQRGTLSLKPEIAEIPPYFSPGWGMDYNTMFCDIKQGKISEYAINVFEGECPEEDYSLKGLLTPELRERFEREGLLNP